MRLKKRILLTLFCSVLFSATGFAQTITMTDTKKDVCQGVTSTTFAYSGTTGGPNRYNVTWDAAAIIAGFSNMTIEVLNPGSIVVNVNNTAAPGVYNATVTVQVGNGGTPGPGSAIQVEVLARPVVNLTAATICSGQNSNLPLTADIGGSTFYWNYVGATNVTGASTQSGVTSISQVLTNNTINQGTAVYEVRAVSPAGCTSVVHNNIQVTVNPIPELTVGASTQTICSGTSPSVALTHNLATGIADTHFSWTIIKDPEIGGPGSTTTGGSKNINQILSNTDNSTAHNIKYTVTANVRGCLSTTKDVDITVNAEPLVNTTSTTICSGQNPNLALTATTGPGSSFFWTTVNQTNVTGATNQSGVTQISNTLTNNTNAQGSAIYEVYGISPQGCTSSVHYNTLVTVNPIPTLTVAPASATICSGGAPAVTLSHNLAVGVADSHFTWTITKDTEIGGAGSTTTGNSQNINQVLTNSSNSATHDIKYTVTATVKGCPSTTKDVDITVAPIPELTSATSKSICSGDNTSMTLTSSSGGGSTFFWTAPAVTGGITGSSAQTGQTSISQVLSNPSNNSAGTVTYTVQTVSANSCTSAVAKDVVITVNPAPVVTPTSATICSGGDPNLNLAASTLGTNSFFWTTVNQTNVTGGTPQSGVTKISNTLTNTTNNTVGTATYEVFAVSQQSCTSAVKEDVPITVNPAPEVTPTSATICSGGDPNLNLAASTPGTSTFFWTTVNQTNVTGATNQSGVSKISNTLNNTTNNTVGTAVYEVYAISQLACTSAVKEDVTITVNPAPDVNAASATICSGGNPNLALTATPGATSFFWTTVNQTNVTGATAQSGVTTISDVLTNTTNSTVGTAVYEVYAIAPNSCTSTVAKDVTITVNPIPDFTVTPSSQTICSGNAPSVALSHTAGANLGSHFSWTITKDAEIGGPGSTTSGGSTSINQVLTNSSNTTAHAIKYTVLATVNGCAAASTKDVDITVNPAPIVFATAKLICSEDSSDLALTASTAGPSTFYWTFIDTTNVSGATLQSGQTKINQKLTNTTTNTLGNAIYHVFAVSQQACSSINHQKIQINVKPKPVLTVSPSSQTICSGTAPAVGLSHTTGTNDASHFTWTITKNTEIGGPGSTTTGNSDSINQVLTNSTNSTVHDIKYTVTATVNGCASDTKDVDIDVAPIPVMTSATSKTICSGQNTNLTLTSSSGGGSTFFWAAPTVTGGITGASAQSGQTSISQVLTNPSNNTSHTATYAVQTVSANACTSAVAQNVVFTVDPTPVLLPGTTDICSGQSISMTPSTPSTINWNIGTITPAAVFTNVSGHSGGTGDTIINQTLTNTHPTLTATIPYNITLLQSNKGCFGATGVQNVTVNPNPALTLKTTSIDTLCSGGNVNLEVEAPIASTYTWTVAAGTGTVTGASAGTTPTSTATPINQTLANASSSTPASVKYIITPTSVAKSCVGNPLEVFAVVNPKPVLNNATDSICSGTAPNITLSASTASTYTWTINNPNGITGPGTTTTGAAKIDSVLNSPNSAIELPITYRVVPTSTVITAKNGGCVGDTVDVPVIVRPLPQVNPSTVSPICSGQTTNVILTATTSGSSTFSWPTPNTTSNISGHSAQSGQTSISQTLSNSSNFLPGTATYIVTATSDKGCVGVVTRSFTVTVNPLPALTAASKSAVMCSETRLNHTLTSSLTGTSFNYVPDNSTNYSVISASSTANPITDSIVNNSATDSVVVRYLVTSTSTASCVSQEELFVTVHPKPVINTLNNTTPICSGEMTDISMRASTGASTSLVWPQPTLDSVAGPTGGSGSGDPFKIQQQIINFSKANPKTFTYTVTPTSTKGCVGYPTNFVVDINPNPILAITDTTICSETLLNFTPVATTPTAITQFTYTVVPSSNTVTPVGNPTGGEINHMISSGGILNSDSVIFEYKVTSQSCQSTDYFTVAVLPKPDTPGIVSTASDLCQNTNLIQMNARRNAQTGGTNKEVFFWTANNGAIINQNGDPYNRENCLVSFPNAGNTEITLFSYVTQYPQCANNGTKVNVNVKPNNEPNPSVVLFNGNTLVCLANNVTQNTNPIVSYQWGYTEKSTLKDVELTGRTRQDIVLTQAELDAMSSRHYWVMANFADGCRRKAYYNSPGVGIKKAEALTEASMKVYPNPAHDQVTIEVDGVDGKEYTVEIYDLSGRILKKEQFRNNKMQVSVDGLAQGYYMIMCKLDGEKIAVTKFIKN